MTLRPAAELLLIEATAIEPILRATAGSDFERPTVCEGWSVRDVMAHCAAALTRTASGDLHDFSPKNNQADVDARRDAPVADVLAELLRGYEEAAAAIDHAGGILDGVGLGEWMHGGDIREALEVPGAYESAGIDLALDLLVERSKLMAKRNVRVLIRGRELGYGLGEQVGTIDTDEATFVRICGGRNPDPSRFQIDGAISTADLVLFS